MSCLDQSADPAHVSCANGGTNAVAFVAIRSRCDARRRQLVESAGMESPQETPLGVGPAPAALAGPERPFAIPRRAGRNAKSHLGQPAAGLGWLKRAPARGFASWKSPGGGEYESSKKFTWDK